MRKGKSRYKRAYSYFFFHRVKKRSEKKKENRRRKNAWIDGDETIECDEPQANHAAVGWRNVTHPTADLAAVVGVGIEQILVSTNPAITQNIMGTSAL